MAYPDALPNNAQVNPDTEQLLTPSFPRRPHKFRMTPLHFVIGFMFSFLFVYLLFAPSTLPQLNPVIFVPGDGGSRVEAKLNKSSTVHYICDKTTSDWFTLWLNLELLVPEVIDCFIDNLRLLYNNVTRTTSNSPGVSLRFPGFGHTDPVEWLDPSVRIGSYFSSIAAALVPLGYVRDLSMRGAPYDFRKAPNENQAYFADLKALIEETYDLNGGATPIVLVAHSMGSLMSLYFLQRQSSAWKKKFIRSLVTLAAPWGGSVKAIKVFAVGDDLGVYVLSKNTLKVYQVTCPSTSWLLPSEHYWSKDEVLVQTPETNYTLTNLEQFFEDIDFKQGWDMRVDVRDVVNDVRPPGVELHCLHGSHVSTPKQLVYGPKKFPDSPQYVMDDGDGTVNMRSLQGCTKWQGKQAQPVIHRVFPNADHMSLLSDKNLLSYLAELLKLKSPDEYETPTRWKFVNKILNFF
uniref:Group XV phospholipase A2 n=1 Tax=Cacopsylla melanoneura TaxID=428564 RepID=A0A8D9FCK2_9HEMI